ncbi:MAG: lipoyl(octanoyl) transferase LipB [Polyangiaceae bacterium]|nr:lipoyl(octanoyl) transferase LipB [Polyangiaceae bacterium]
MSTRTILGYWLGQRSYAESLLLQEYLHALRREQRIPDTVLFLEHEPVITLGRGAKAEHLLASEAELGERRVALVKTGRGGDVTLHAPGQLVCYPIFDLAPDRQDVRAYVNRLTEVMQGIVATYGISAGNIPGYVGLWVDADSPSVWPGRESALTPKKLGAIGVRISRWVTMHGFALNLSIDLSQFSLIVPCGIREYGVTSLSALTGSAPSAFEAAELAFGLFGRTFRATIGPLFSLEGEDPQRHFERTLEAS